MTTERTTVRLPTDLLDRVRRKAAVEGRTLTALIEDGLRAVLSEHRKSSGRRILPRISKARGGLMPGVDLTKPSAFEETADLQQIGRMRQAE
ncbi:MAG TPA: ribbon-helix-helix protein, CopG family [Stellaceae bacterium]|jgi:hypothetical protein|nr:ribbon-helix-helix protein, CopG family [Stellaceae bacterium]